MSCRNFRLIHGQKHVVKRAADLERDSHASAITRAARAERYTAERWGIQDWVDGLRTSIVKDRAP